MSVANGRSAPAGETHTTSSSTGSTVPLIFNLTNGDEEFEIEELKPLDEPLEFDDEPELDELRESEELLD